MYKQLRTAFQGSRTTSVGIVAAVIGLVVASGCSATGGDSDAVPFRNAESIWETKLDGDVDVAGVQAVGDEVVVQGERGGEPFVEVLDADSGSQLWRTKENETAKALAGDVWIGESYVAFFLDERTISIRDTRTGATERELKLEPENLAGVRPYVLGFTGSIMFAVEAHKKNSRKISAIDVSTGESLWTDKLDHTDGLVGISTAPSGLPGTGSISIGGDEVEPGPGTVERIGAVEVVLITKRSDPEFAVAVEGKTGDELWRQATRDDQTTTVATTSTGQFVTLAVDSRESCDVTAFVGSAKSKKPREVAAHQYRYDKKKDKWRCGASNLPGTSVTAESLLTQDGEHRPVVIDLKTGESVWRADEAGIPRAFGDGVALYQSVSGETVAVDVESGKTLWSSKDLELTSRYTMVKGQLVVSDGSSSRAWSLRSGKRLWAYENMTLIGSDGGNHLFVTASGEHGKTVTLAAVTPSGRKS